MADVEKTVGGTTPDYATFTLFEAAIPSDITAATGTDEHWIGKGRDVEISEDFAVSGITTDSTNRVTITYDTGAKTTGISRDAGGSGITIKGNAVGVIRSSVQHLTIDGIDLAVSSNNPLVTLTNIVYQAGNDTLIKNCILRGITSSSSSYLISASKSSLNFRMENCIGYSGRRFIDTRNSASAEISYCTVLLQADNLGIVSDSELTCKNTYVGRVSGSAEDFWTAGASPSGNNNASSDTSSTTDYTSSITSKAPGDQFVSVTTGSEDFTLKSGSDLEAAGAVLSITTDIIGTARDGTTPDIGAFEFVAAGTTVDVPVGSLAFTGQVPTIATTANIAVDVPVGSITYTGQTPTILTPVSVDIPVGSLAYTGLVPTIIGSGNLVVAVPVGSMTYVGLAPSANVSNNISVEIPVGAISFTGQAPTIIAINPILVNIPTGAIIFTGLPPLISTGGWAPQGDAGATWSDQADDSGNWIIQ